MIPVFLHSIEQGLKKKKKKSFIKINHVSISQSISEYVQFIGACSVVVVAVDLTFLLYDCISSSLLCTWCRLIKA